MGFEVFALTLDNGFISEGALENVRRSVADLGIDHEFVRPEAMAEIFRDSLERHSNVCNGCYKTIYTVATTKAVELGAPLIVTGLSRGQLFETRLIPAQFGEDRFDPDAIDRAVLQARKAYHRVDDAPRRLLDTSVFDDDSVFERVRYVDFYRYVDVALGDMLDVPRHAGAVGATQGHRPIHQLPHQRRGHPHPPAGAGLPQLRRAVRVGRAHGAQDARRGHGRAGRPLGPCRDRLDAAPRGLRAAPAGGPHGVVRTGRGCSGAVAGRAAHLPRHRAACVRRAGGVPRRRRATHDHQRQARCGCAPPPTRVHRPGPALHVSPESPTERLIVSIWERVLGTEPIGVADDFFDLGGDSLAALEMVMALSAEVGRTIREELVFLNTTPRALAAAVDADAGSAAPAEPGTGPQRRSPGTPPPLGLGERSMLFEQLLAPHDPRYHVGRLYRVHGRVDQRRFVDALYRTVSRHVPLHWTFGEQRRELEPQRAVEVHLRDAAMDDDVLADAARALHRAPFDLDAGPLGRCLVQPLRDGTTGIALVFHHVSIDAGAFDRLWTQTRRPLPRRGAAGAGVRLRRPRRLAGGVRRRATTVRSGRRPTSPLRWPRWSCVKVHGAGGDRCTKGRLPATPCVVHHRRVASRAGSDAVRHRARCAGGLLRSRADGDRIAVGHHRFHAGPPRRRSRSWASS
jgi:acyl carrier protein